MKERDCDRDYCMDSKMSTSTTLGLNEQSGFSDRTRSLKQYSNSVMFPLFMVPVSWLN